MDEIKEYLEQLNEIRADIEQIIKKPLENITQQDVEKTNKFINVYNEAINFFEKHEQRVVEIEKELEEANDTAKKYNLVPREEIISPEKEENLKKELENINKEKEFRDNLENFTNLAKEALDKINDYKKKEEQLELDKKREEVKKVILESKEPEYVWEIRKDGIKDEYCEKPVSSKIMDLVLNHGAIEVATDHTYIPAGVGGHDGTDYYKEISYLSYEQCDLDKKQMIKEREAELKRIREDKSDKYDQKGKIYVPIYEENPEKEKNKRVPRAKPKGVIEIDVTPRELAEGGIDYRDLGWKSLEQIKEEQKQSEAAKVSSKSIIAADRKENATTKDLAPLEKNGFKKWLENVKEVFKNFITGKGEK